MRAETDPGFSTQAIKHLATGLWPDPCLLPVIPVPCHLCSLLAVSLLYHTLFLLLCTPTGSSRLCLRSLPWELTGIPYPSVLREQLRTLKKPLPFTVYDSLYSQVTVTSWAGPPLHVPCSSLLPQIPDFCAQGWMSTAGPKVSTTGIMWLTPHRKKQKNKTMTTLDYTDTWIDQMSSLKP